MNFGDYELDDFLADESFQNWVLAKEGHSNSANWEEWVSKHPEKEEIINQARAILQSFKPEGNVDPKLVREEWDKLQSKLNELPKPAGRGIHLVPMLKYAAVILLLIAVSVGVYTQLFKASEKESFTVYNSDYGQKREIKLPDGSEITLNANSTVRTLSSWDGANREVWLDKGEAFFSITKQADQSNFRVHLMDIEVEVLGTAFNVSIEEGVSIMLSEGSIRLSTNGGGQAIMSPGDYAKFNNDKKLLISKVKDPQKYSLWLNNKISFEDTSLKEISAYVKRYYGVDLIVSDTSLQNRKLTGEIPNDNLDLLISAISVAMDIKVSKRGASLVIENSDNNK